MRTLYVVTHPESTHHVDGLVGGWFDSSLTDRGRAQTTEIGRELRYRIPTDASATVFTSDLKRTVETAEAIASYLATAPQKRFGLREKSYGIAEGREQSWLDARFVPPPADGPRLDHDEGIEGAETKRTMGERVYAVMDEILSQPASHQVVVTHGFASNFVIASWLNIPLDAMERAAFAMSSGSITELVEDDFFHNRTLKSLGSVGHLGGV